MTSLYFVDSQYVFFFYKSGGFLNFGTKFEKLSLFKEYFIPFKTSQEYKAYGIHFNIVSTTIFILLSVPLSKFNFDGGGGDKFKTSS